MFAILFMPTQCKNHKNFAPRWFKTGGHKTNDRYTSKRLNMVMVQFKWKSGKIKPTALKFKLLLKTNGRQIYLL